MHKNLVIIFIFLAATLASAQETDDSTAVKFDIHYSWVMLPYDSCKNVRVSILNWSKNDDSSAYIFDHRDTFTQKPDGYHFKETGEHHVTIISKGKNGKNYIYEKTLYIDCDSSSRFYFPNPYHYCGSQIEFSIIPDSTISNLSIRIFDRWGNFIDEVSGDTISWQGTESKTGKLCPQGTYFYVLFYIDRRGNNRYMYGQISIIR